MAKDKKRGFLSWLGIKRPDDEQVKENDRLSTEDADVSTGEQTAQAEQVAPADGETHTERAAPANGETHTERAAPAVGETHAERVAQDIVGITQRVAQGQGAVPSAPPVAEDRFAAAAPLATVPPASVPSAPAAAPPASASSASDNASLQGDPGSVERDEAELTLAEDVRPIQDTSSPLETLSAQSAPADAVVTAIIDDEPAEPIAVEQARPTREGFFARLKRGLLKTRQNLGSGFIGLFRGKKIDDDLFEELEEQLLIADVGVETTRKIIASLTEHADRSQLKDADALYVKLKEEMAAILANVSEPLRVGGETPFVILMVGVNGVGKTTTIGKLARQYQAEGKTVMLAAGDTFRAAAVEQLQVWGQRNHIPVVAQHTGADSASVIFDAIQAAKARCIDVLIADTAGRLQNKSHLMDELKKIVRVMKKLDVNAPHEVMLTLDASTGQNAVSQARLFNDTVPLTGITLTKLDGTAKGGVIFAVADQFGIPIRYIGVGEGIDDLRPFNADDFIEALFARED
ncbi:signal recognition particle-docking protein FtsY [Acerihabitans sp. KWT182]|uniref:Signal recognition particle receptor FtsY n=1 Tax=Acerihabitans sp. KWT182 TaxID=3157919 RepID=A0AAU7Q970_9GAMM